MSSVRNQSIRILLVEDDEAQANFLKAVLAKSFKIEWADCLSAALERLTLEEFDVVVLDLGLPDSSGLDTLAATQIVAASLPIIVLTAMDAEQIASKALRRGAQDFVEKSELNLNLLARSIRHALDRKRLEEQLLQAQKLEAVGELSAGVAHEFNNLLQSIRGYTKFALDEIPKESQAYADLQHVMKASDDAAKLTRQLLSFGRRNALRRELANPNDVIQEQLDMLRPLIGEQIELAIDLQEEVGMINVDATELKQMLLNLCINARDAMHNGGRLAIRTQRRQITDDAAESLDVDPGHFVEISVADSGSGMSAEVQQRIFEPFFTTKEVGKGTGMGLAMVYGAIQQHGGGIEVVSHIGIGTTMRVLLPLAHCPVQKEHVPEVQKVEGGAETILFAEDNPMVRDLGVRILQSAGYRTLVAQDGAQAIEVFEQSRDEISLTLLDVVMPKMTGRDVFDVVLESRPDMPFVFCTGYDPDGDQTDFLDRNQYPIVHKPFTSEDLLSAVRDALDEQKPVLASSPA